uniref:nuclear pore complex protein NUP1-like n=1 Tax=Fragaria vesca subsp. vesca TaxID=101020 RepID=UPI0005CB3E96|nr:PREDICTED: nuclear pore complex protein NUP1-like [Fragaria vesca subsp. vesca]
MNNSDAEVPFRVPEILVSSSAAPTSIFSTNSQVSNNLASQSSLSSMAPTANTNSGNNIAATSAVTTSNLFSPVSAPSFSAEPCSKFSVSSATTVTQVPENSPLELLGDKNKQDGGFANLSRTVLPGTSTTSAGTENSFVGVSAAASFPTATNQSGPTFSSGSGSGLGVQASPGLLFKCEPSSASTALTSGSSSLEFLNDRNKQGGSFGTVSSSLFSGTFATSASASSNSFGFSAAASMPTVTSQAPGSSLFSGGSGTGSGTHLSPAGTGVAASTQSAPVQPGSSSSSSVFNFVGNTAFSSGSSFAYFVWSIHSFCSNYQQRIGVCNIQWCIINWSPSGNNDQMSMEDSMAEDTVHALQPTVAAFGQQPVSAPQSTPTFQFTQQPVSTPQTPFVFGGSSNGFPFQSQQNQSNSQNPSPFQPVNSLANAQNPSPFQGSNSLGLPTSSFSLGAPDKSNRRIVKVNRSKNRKK